MPTEQPCSVVMQPGYSRFRRRVPNIIPLKNVHRVAAERSARRKDYRDLNRGKSGSNLTRKPNTVKRLTAKLFH